MFPKQNESRHLWMGVMSHTHTTCTIGCLKLQVSFRKRATNYRALVQEMTYEDKTSYGSWPHCRSCSENDLKSMSHVIREWESCHTPTRHVTHE